MIKKFFVVFSRDGTSLPKLYKRQIFAKKYLSTSNNCTKQVFDDLNRAETFFSEKMRENYLKVSNNIMMTLTTNLSLSSKPKQPEQTIISKNIQISQNQRQERQKYINELIQKYKFFGNSHFKSVQAKFYQSTLFSGFFDGASKHNPGKSSVGYFINDDNARQVLSRSEFIGSRTNNQAQSLSLFMLLSDAYCNNILNLKVFGDSKLTIGFMNKTMRPSNEFLITYTNANMEIAKKFKQLSFSFIPREHNYKADRLANRCFQDYNKELKLKRKKSDVIDPSERPDQS